MNFKIFRSGEDFTAARKGTRERLLSSVYPHVVDKFVFRLERAAIPRTTLPVARVVGLLGPSHVLDRDVSDYLVHGGEDFAARLPGLGLVLVQPLTRVLLLDWMPHEGVESSGPVGTHVHSVMAHGVHVV